MNAGGPYAAAWRRYRLWSRVFWLLFVSFLPVMVLTFRALGPRAGAAIFGVALVWMIALTIVGYQTGNFACPRCGEMFFRKFDDRPWRRSWVRNPFARKCMHCGLPKWAAGPT